MKIGNGVLLGILSIFALTGCAPSVIKVPMSYTPTRPPMALRNVKDTPFYFVSFVDQRNNPDFIGENAEGSSPIPAKAPPQEIMSCLENAFKTEFSKSGLKVVDSPDKAERFVSVVLQSLWVRETETFRTMAGARVEVKDKSGEVLANEGFTGYNSRWGRSYSPKEYRITISDAFLNLIKSVFVDDNFMRKIL